IGTNGLPFLLRLIGARNSPWKERANAMAREHSWISFHLSQADDHYAAAVQGLIVLGPDAAPAVPALIALLNNTDPGVRGAAASALGAIKPEPERAVPALIQHLNETDEFALLNIVRALGDIHRKPEL